VTTIRRRLASLIALALPAMAIGCGSDGIVLPDDSKPAKITIVSGNAQSAPAGVALSQPLVVRVTDGFDRAVEGQTVAFTIDVGGGQVTPASVVTGPDGQASTSWTLGASAGQQRVQATVSGDGLPAGLLATFNAMAVSGAGAKLVLVSGDHQTAAVGSALPESLVVRVTDELDNPVAAVEVTWTVGGGGLVSPTTVLSDANGLAAVQRVLGNTAGTQTAEASSTGLSSIPFTHTAEAANPTALVLISGDAQIAPAGSTLSDPLVVRLVDDNGNGVGGKAVTWLVAPGGGGGSVNPLNGITSPTGYTQTSWTLGANAGSYLLNAVFSGVPSVPFTAMATAGTATKLAFIQAPVTTSAGSTIAPAVKVAIKDAAGNTVTSATDAVTLAIGNNPAGGTLSGTVTVNAVSGVATFGNLSIDKSGNGYTLTAAATGLAGVTSPSFDIVPGTANRLVFLTGPSDRAVGQAFSPALQVQVQDAGGNPVILATGQITLTSSVTGTLSGTATATPILGTATFNNLAVNKAGTGYTLTALASGVSSTASSPFDVAKGTTTISITSKSPSGSSVFGQAVTFNYDINISAPAAGSLTGTVTVSDGTDSCTGGITAGTGIGNCPILFSSTGTKSVTATYNGDQNFDGSTSAPAVSHTVNKANTSLSITSALPNPSAIGQSITVQWTLAPTGAGGGTPTGDVTVTVSGGSETCSAPAAFGSGSCALVLNASGNRTITASYPGDGNFNAAPSDNEPHNVLAATTTSLTSGTNPSTVGQNVTFTAHVAPTSGTGSPSGAVKFFDGVTELGQSNLNGSGNASFTENGLTEGSHSITAAYQGSGSFAGSTSNTVTQTVNPVPNTPPTATDDPSYSTLEDTPVTVDAGHGVLKNDDDPDNGPQPLIARNASDPANGSVTLNSDGSFTYTPDADYNGTDTFTYEAFDGAAASTATVTVTITAVNDAPSFTAGPNVNWGQGDGAYSQAWATNVSAGPADESGQALTFTVSVGTGEEFLFSSQPSIASDGTLTFTPSGIFTGTATVTVHLEDNGGTANGGVDARADQQFTITIN
jgi:VCBS repeat-containing protein